MVSDLSSSPSFRNKWHEFIHNIDTGVWVVAYTECVVRVCTAMLWAAYDENRL